MNPIEKAIDVLEGIMTFGLDDGDLGDVSAAIQALRSMQEVDVDVLIKPDGDTMGGLVKSRGWNEAVRHISQNYHLIPKE